MFVRKTRERIRAAHIWWSANEQYKIAQAIVKDQEKSSQEATEVGDDVRGNLIVTRSEFQEAERQLSIATFASERTESEMLQVFDDFDAHERPEFYTAIAFAHQELCGDLEDKSGLDQSEVKASMDDLENIKRDKDITPIESLDELKQNIHLTHSAQIIFANIFNKKITNKNLLNVTEVALGSAEKLQPGSPEWVNLSQIFVLHLELLENHTDYGIKFKKEELEEWKQKARNFAEKIAKNTQLDPRDATPHDFHHLSEAIRSGNIFGTDLGPEAQVLAQQGIMDIIRATLLERKEAAEKNRRRFGKLSLRQNNP